MKVGQTPLFLATVMNTGDGEAVWDDEDDEDKCLTLDVCRLLVENGADVNKARQAAICHRVMIRLACT